MLGTADLTALAVFAFVASITPGPNNLMLMTSGINYGVARSVPHMLGVGVGLIVMFLLVGAGVSKVFETVPGSSTILKIVSAVYLFYLAWRIATAEPPRADVAAHGRPLTFLQAAAFQWVNPKGWTMALTATSVYVPVDAPLVDLFVVALVFGAITFPSVGIWTVLGGRLRRLLHRPRLLRAFNIVAASLLIVSLYPLLSSDLPSALTPTGCDTK